MQRDADLVDGLAVHLEQADALGDHGHRLDVAPLGRHLDPLAGDDAQLPRQRFADLDELLGLGDGVQPAVLGPEVEVLGEAVGGRRIGELVGGAEHLAVPGNRRAAGLLVTLRFSGCNGLRPMGVSNGS